MSKICLPRSKVQFKKVIRRIGYWRGLGSSDDFAGRSLANCVEVIHADIVNVWNLPDEDRVRLLFVMVVLPANEISTCQVIHSKSRFLIL